MATKTTKDTSKEVSKQASNGLIKTMLFFLTLLTIVVGYLTYQVFTSDAMAKTSQQTMTSLFHSTEKEKLFALGEFTVKLSDGSYAQLSMSVGYIGDEKELPEIKPVVRDKVIFSLMKFDRTNLNVQHIEGTKGILIEQLNPLLKKSEIKHIYIDNLTLQ